MIFFGSKELGLPNNNYMEERFLCDPVWRQELDSMILMSLFQLQFYGSSWEIWEIQAFLEKCGIAGFFWQRILISARQSVISPFMTDLLDCFFLPFH